MATPATPLRDFGPDIRMKAKAAVNAPKGSGTVAAQRRAAAARVVVDPLRIVAKEFRLDPDRLGTLVRGARVRDPLRKMWEALYITKRQWDAAEAFRDDAALATGARVNQPEDAGVRTPMSNRNWPSETQLAALNRVNTSMGLLCPQERELVTWSLLEHKTLSDFTRQHRMRNESGGPMLQGVLTHLALFHFSSGKTAP